MQRLLAVLMVMLLAFTVACGDDDDEDVDVGDAGETPVVTPADDEEPTETPADEEEPTATLAGEDEATATPADEDEATATAADENGENGVEGDAAAGEELATELGCFTCHSTDGTTLVGPTWQGLYGSEVPLESGETVTADDDYIRESILEPNAQIHEGFSAVMPAFDLTDEEINNIIAYIQTLD